MHIRAQQNPINPARAAATPKPAKLLPEGELLSRYEERFAEWDRNLDGRISWGEMRQNLADPQIKGAEAVELASLYGLMQHDMEFRGLHRPGSLSPERLETLYYEYSDYDTDVPVADTLHQKFQDKLNRAPQELFPNELPNAHFIRQGAAPSCGFLATTFAVAKRDPQEVKEAIKETEKGFEVRFPGLDKPVVVSPLTDSEKAMFSSAGKDGAWITVLEKAWGAHLSKGNPLRAFEETTNPKEAIVAWTGGKGATSSIPQDAPLVKRGETPAYLTGAAKELASEHVVVAWTRFNDLSDDDLVPGHAYTVTAYDPDKQKVTVRNPWGRQEPKGKDGRPLDGKDDGVFEYKVADFQRNFGKIARQTA